MKTVIMHKGQVWKGIYFDSPEQARNFLKFHYPQQKFKEPVKNKLVHSNYGTTFIITELQHFQDKDQ